MKATSEKAPCIPMPTSLDVVARNWGNSLERGLQAKTHPTLRVSFGFFVESSSAARTTSPPALIALRRLCCAAWVKALGFWGLRGSPKNANINRMQEACSSSSQVIASALAASLPKSSTSPSINPWQESTECYEFSSPCCSAS